MTGRFGRERDVHVPQAAFLVLQRLLHEPLEIFDAERLQREELRARDERTVDVEEGIVRGGADKAQGAALEMRQEYVLLGFVKPVDLVHEKDGALAVEA